MSIKQDLENQLLELTSKRKSLEVKISDYQTEFAIMKQLIDADLEQLKEIQTQEMDLKIAFFNAQKNEIVESLSINNIKNIISGSPLFSRVKNKAMKLGKGVSDLFSEASSLDVDTEWLNSSYEKYKKVCFDAGKEFINKEEFKKIIHTTQSFAKNKTDDIEEVYKSISHATGLAQEQIKNVWDTIVANADDTEQNDVLDKKVIFKEWFDANVSKKTKVEENKKELYDSYVSFIITKYNDEALAKFSYTYKSGAFTSALNKEYINSFK